jgi:adenosylcobinamide-phosphate synthase
MFSLEIFAIVALALILDAFIGDPKTIYTRVPHPVVLIGNLISLMEKALNRPALASFFRRSLGCLTIVALVVGSGFLGIIISNVLAGDMWGAIVQAFLIAILLAGKSLAQHIAAVRDGLLNGGLGDGRIAVAAVVGRDPSSLDEYGVARAGIESLAENFSDGVVAPIFWALIFGLPGILVYKTVNTADSMIGHKTDRYWQFGWASARLDDFLNLVPARISGLLIVIASMASRGGSAKNGFRSIIRDAGYHRSPNAGYPEAAMAGVLGLKLAGPRRYGDEVIEDAWMGNGRENASPSDINRALRVYWSALTMIFLICAAVSAQLL